MIDIVLDLETLGTHPGCPIIEIGACAVDPDGGAIVANFSRRVCSGFSFENVSEVADGAICFGWKIERDTARWWLADGARAETLRGLLNMSFSGPALETSLDQFSDWFSLIEDGDREHTRIWANGPSFDIAILDDAYTGAGMTRPWICWQERCVRTALELCGYKTGSVAWTENGPRHRALNDARHEAKKLWHCGALGDTSMVARRLRERGTIG